MRLIAIIMAGMVACGAWGAGEFNASTGTIDASALISDAQVQQATTVSILAWIKPNGFAADNIFFSITRDADATRTDLFLEEFSAGGLAASLNYDGVNQWNLQDQSTLLTIGSWYHFAVTHNGTQPSIYLNGQSFGAFTVSTDKTKWFKALLTDATSKSDTATIGGFTIDGGATAIFFNGDIDDVRIISRALSQAEIADIYRERARVRNYTAYTNAIATGVFEDSVAYHDVVGGTNYLELHWDGNGVNAGYGDTITNAIDRSVNQHTLTVTGGVTQKEK